MLEHRKRIWSGFGRLLGRWFSEAVCLQVVTSIGELVEMCSPQILSGWRPLFSALRTVHSSKTDPKGYLLGEYSMGTTDAQPEGLFRASASQLFFSPPGKSQAPVFDVFEAFINTDNIQVFANAATDYIMCLMKFVKGLGWCSLSQRSRRTASKMSSWRRSPSVAE